jgi:hypothetical protein
MTTNAQVSGPALTELSTPARRDGDNLSTMRPPAIGGRADNQATPRGRTRNSAPDLATHQLHVALTWLHRGHPVIPCSCTDKGPLVPGFGRDATEDQLAPFSDERQVTEWWTGRYRRAHVGILTRRLVVVDLDAQGPGAHPLTGRWDGCVHGSDVLEVRMREAGITEWPETYEVETPSKGKPVPGRHLYFLQPDDPIGCATGDGPGAPHIGPLVDVRGVGGLVIAAGSHSTAQGRPYTRVSPAGLRPQPLPDWLLGILRPAAPPTPVRPPAPVVHQLPTGDRAERYAAAALRGQVDSVAAARDGGRWATLSGAALRLAELSETAPRVLTYQVVMDALLGAAAACGLGEREAERAIQSAWNRKAGTVGGAA